MLPTVPTLRCKKCSYTWVPRVSDPKVCPRCKSRDWDKDGTGRELAVGPQKEVGK